tara:strand:- start:253 stop:651 length:399 start_codon:yes stop_codon:yes gene_type:complete
MDLRILEIASCTENNKELDHFTHQSKNKNMICGDVMEISLIVKNNVVTDMGYQCKSCVYCEASVSLLSQKIKNKNLTEIKEFIQNAEKMFDNVKVSLGSNWKDFKKLLDKKNISRKECLLLPLKTVLKALKI